MGSKHKEAAELEALYHSCVGQLGPAFDRLSYAYESDSDRRRDLVQEIHTALWLSLRVFDGRCSLRTWAYRVAHNTAASHVARCLRDKARNWVDLERVEHLPDVDQNEGAVNQRILLDKLLELIQGLLGPVDRQVILLYLEGMDSGEIAEIVGVQPTNVTTKIHRIKKLLAYQFQKGAKYNAIRSLEYTDAVGVAVSADDAFQTVCVEPAAQRGPAISMAVATRPLLGDLDPRCTGSLLYGGCNFRRGVAMPGGKRDLLGGPLLLPL